jgi:hypothetical protein
VAERWSAFNGIYENYGSCAANAGFTVFKLDDTGTPFNISYFGRDEFVYNNSGNNTTWPVDMTFYNTGAPYDEGLHLFGNLNNGGPGRHYFAQAYFSGEDGCNAPAVIASYSMSMPNITAQTPSNGSNLTVCNGFNITQTSNSTYVPVCGPVNSVGGGSNNKSVGITQQAADNKMISVSPNPVKDMLQLNFGAVAKGDIKIDVQNCLGQHVKSLTISQTDGKAAVDFSSLNVESGVYLIHANISGKTYNAKVVYDK